MSLPFNPLEFASAASSMGIPPEYVQMLLRNPEQAKRMFDQVTEELRLQSSSNATIDGSDNEDVKQFIRDSKEAKERSLRERNLPPVKAPLLLREHLVYGLEYKRKDCEKSMPSILQTFAGLSQEYSSTPVENLQPSTDFYLVFVTGDSPSYCKIGRAHV